MSAPWMPLYVADYLADTGHLSAAEHGAYLMLIMHYWRVGSLPTDEKALARISRMSDREWKRSRDTISAFFAPGWKHERIENELKKAADKTDRRVEAGSRGGNAKALKSKDTTLAIATVLPEPEASIALASSSPSPLQEDANASSSGRADLIEFKKRVTAAYAAAKSTKSPDTHRLEIWLQNGWKPDICVPVIAEVLSRKPEIGALKYFEQAIAEAHVKPVGKPVATAFGKPSATIRLGPDESREAAKALGQVYVMRESAEGEAWNKFKLATTGRSQWWDQNGGSYFPSALPPSAHPVKQGEAA